jgi:hypothetical protein
VTDIKHDSSLNETAGFFDKPTAAVKPLSSTDKSTLLNLIWALTYTEDGRKILKENRPKKPAAGAAALDDATAEKNLTKWIKDNFAIQDETLIGAVVAAHLAADAWIEAKDKLDTVELARQKKIYQQNVAVVTWMLWEDAMAHEFSMNW